MSTSGWKLLALALVLTVGFAPLGTLSFSGVAAAVGNTLTAAGNASPGTAQIGETVTFDASGSTGTSGSTTYEWDVDGDGTVDYTGQSVTHAYSTAGTYTATLTLTDGGSLSTDTVTVIVDGTPPSPDLQVFPSIVTVNETAYFDASATVDDVGIAKYEWDFEGDGTYDTTTTPSSPNGGTFVSHSYTSSGQKSPTLRVTDDAGNTATVSRQITVRPEPNVTATTVTWTGNGTQPTGSIAVNTSLGGGMLMLYLHPQGNQNNRDIASVADTSTELWVNLTIENYAPDAVMGGAKLHNWSTASNTNGQGTNFTLSLQPVELQRLSSFTGIDPNQWPSGDNQADIGIQAGVYLGTFDIPSSQSDFEQNMSGATLTSDAQAFMPPRYNQQAGTLNYSVAAPHWKKALDGNGNKVQNVGFYEAVIPAGMVGWMGIQNPDELAGSYRTGGQTSDLRDMQVETLADGSLHINVTGIHYSSGTVTLSKDRTAPSADAGSSRSGTAGAAVTFDASPSSDNRAIQTYEWDFDGDGTNDASSSSATTSHTYSSAGDYTATLRVTDGAGNTDTDTVGVAISAEGSGSGGTAPAPVGGPHLISRGADSVGFVVTNVRPGAVATVEVPQPTGKHAVAVTELDVNTTAAVASMDLSVETLDGVPAGTPPLDDGRHVVPIDYLAIDHSIASHRIAGIGFTVTADAAAVPGDSADVTLYRYSGGTWSPLETTLETETDGQYVFVAESPGLSVFALGQRQPAITVVDAGLATDSIAVDDPLTVDVVVENDGTAAGSVTLEVTANGRGVAQRAVAVAAGDRRSVQLAPSFARAGAITVAVNGRSLGTVAVESDRTPTPTVATAAPRPAVEATDTSTPLPSPSPTRTRSAGTTETPGQPGFLALGALLSIALLAGRRLIDG